MIITEPAAIIIGEMFGQSAVSIGRLRLKGRERRHDNPFTTQAYVDSGVVPATNRAGTTVHPQHSAMQRRETPLR
jgi:hypothetical protein